MKIIFKIIIILSIFAVNFAQENISTKEVGIYQRKSVAFFNTVVNESNKELPAHWAESLVSALQKSVRFARFDYNRIPKRMVKKFNDMPSYLSIEERMNATIVPAILRAVNAKKEIRAEALLSEQQKNSFITDKAKELGITEIELNEVMNSAYIFAPVFLDYTDTTFQEKTQITDKDGNTYEHTNTIYRIYLSAGGYWWKINNTYEESSVKPIAKITRTYSGSVNLDDGYEDYKYAAFNSLLSSLAQSIEIATKNIPDFQLSAQVLERNMRNIVLSIGNGEGIKTDDKFWVYESIEDSIGNITQKKDGWIMIKKVGKNAKGLDDTQSQAQIISGTPYIGSTVREIIQLPFDITFGFSQLPFSLDKVGQRKFKKAFNLLDDVSKENPVIVNNLKNIYMGNIHDFDLSNMYGPKLKLNFNLLRKAGVSQLWLGMGGEFLFGNASGTLFYEKLPYNINSSMGFGLEISLAKKIYIRRLALVPEIDFGVNCISLFTDHENSYPKTRKDIYISNWDFGAKLNWGIEFAISPFFNIGTTAGYQYYKGNNNSWNLRYYENKTVKNEDGTTENKGNWKAGHPVLTNDLLKTNGLAYSFYISFNFTSSSKMHDIIN